MKCPLFLALPLSYPSCQPSSSSLSHGSREHYQAVEAECSALHTQRYLELYSTLLAIQHINEHDGEFIPWLSNVTYTCPKNNTTSNCNDSKINYDNEFTIPYAHLSDASESLHEYVTHGTSNHDNDQQTGWSYFINDTSTLNYEDGGKCEYDNSFCGFVGPLGSNFVEVDMLLDLLEDKNDDIMQVTPYAFVSDFDHNYRLKRVSVGAQTIASRLYEYLSTTLNRRYIAVVYDMSREKFGTIFREYSNMAGSKTIVEVARYDGEGVSHVSYALEAVAALNFSTIVFVESSYTRALMPLIMSKADELGLLSNNHMWMIVPHELSCGLEYYKHLNANMKMGSYEEKFLRGLQFFDYANVRLLGSFSSHLQSDQNLDPNIVDVIPTLSPLYFNVTEITHYRLSHDVHLTNAGLLYDSVLTLLSSLCKSLGDLKGVTGKIGATKDSSNDTYANAFSVLNLDTTVNENDLSTVSTVASIREGLWESFENATYFDGSNTPPSMRFVEEDMNYISPTHLLIVVIAFLSNLLFASALSYCVYEKREDSRVYLLESEFLYTLIISELLGSFIILILIIDERLVSHNGRLLDWLCSIVVMIRDSGQYLSWYAFYIKLITIKLELTTGQRRSYPSVFFSRYGFLPLTMYIAGVFRIFLRGFVSWERDAIRLDEYGFTMESQGNCTVTILFETTVAHLCFALLFFTYFMYIHIRFNEIYNSMGLREKQLNAHIMKQLNQVSGCGAFQSLGLVGLLFLRICAQKLSFRQIRVIYSCILSLSAYVFIVFPALLLSSHYSVDTESPPIYIETLEEKTESDISSITNSDFSYKRSVESKTTIDQSLEYLANVDKSSVESVSSLVC